MIGRGSERHLQFKCIHTVSVLSRLHHEHLSGRLRRHEGGHRVTKRADKPLAWNLMQVVQPIESLGLQQRAWAGHAPDDEHRCKAPKHRDRCRRRPLAHRALHFRGPWEKFVSIIMSIVWVAPSLAFLGGAAVCRGLFRVSSVCDPSSLHARVRAMAVHKRLLFSFFDAHDGQVLPDAVLAPLAIAVPQLVGAHLLIAWRCKTIQGFYAMRASPLILSITGFGLGVSTRHTCKCQTCTHA